MNLIKKLLINSIAIMFIQKIKLFSFVIFLLCIKISLAQDITSKYSPNRDAAFQQYVAFQDSMADSSLANLKKLVRFQTELINIDNCLVNDSLPAHKKKIAEINKKTLELETAHDKLITKAREKESLFLYFYIGSGLLFLLFATFLFMFILKAKKVKKLKSKENDLEKLEHALEDEKKKSLTQSQSIQTEYHLIKTELEKEIYNLKSKNTDLMLNNSKLESQLKEVKLQIASAENKVSQLTKEIENKQHQNPDNNEQLQIMQSEIDALKKERTEDLQMLKDIKELYEKVETERQALQIQITNKAQNSTTELLAKLEQEKQKRKKVENDLHILLNEMQKED